MHFFLFLRFLLVHKHLVLIHWLFFCFSFVSVYALTFDDAVAFDAFAFVALYCPPHWPPCAYFFLWFVFLFLSFSCTFQIKCTLFSEQASLASLCILFSLICVLLSNQVHSFFGTGSVYMIWASIALWHFCIFSSFGNLLCIDL